MAYASRVGNTTSRLANVSPIALDLEKRTLVDMDEGYGSIAPTCLTKNPETGEARLGVDILN